ncbi:CHAP domain-containing protein [Roseococcus sp. SYP-B2431]|uniref:CHAP domain-containing protein n=1 Tax=Roseococcus sp. SYP-B2431 TaxID=2496640 RepID=UPI00103A0EF7|nr:CHAP domain-containing protein [Roseococcus sp. SYP-B2431]TCH99837.1 CHAP domain-containing protein [Roseococcus sp. SYP-B2431]
MRLRIATIAMGLLLCAAPFAQQAEAARGDARSEARSQQPRNARTTAPALSNRASRAGRGARASQASGGGGISCVPYARSVTGMAISGNGRDWWENSAGRYARGQRPQIGSVLSFQGSGGMRSGHVAVVSRVMQPRMIEIDHANWGGPGIRRGTVMRNVRVMDVSPDNSWTRVRVQVGWTSENFGREYPTDGFIHNRPANSYVAGVDDMIRPVSYTTRTEAGERPARRSSTRSAARATQPRQARAQSRPSESRTARRTQANAVSARTGQPVRLASAPTTR